MIKLKTLLTIVIFCLSATFCLAQSYVIKGIVLNSSNQPLDVVNVIVAANGKGVITNSKGEFQINIENKSKSVELIFSLLGFETQNIVVKANKNGVFPVVKVTLAESSTLIKQVDVVSDKGYTSTKIVKINGLDLSPVSVGGVETIIKTFPGVVSNNEMSSQYSVRGGNFDENLVYINGVEVYKPFLIKSGQQEGLSAVNPDLVGNVKFSAGGFNSNYGDKLSSVLDIQYRRPTQFEASAKASLLGGSLHIGGVSKDKKLSVMSGARYKTNSFFLGTLQTEGEYTPSFFDFQLFSNYKLSQKTEVSVLANIALNRYNFIPKNRETTFGSLANIQTLRIYYEGREVDKFNTSQVSLNINNKLSDKVFSKTSVSGYISKEKETYDILGQYWLQDLDNDNNLTGGADGKLNIGVGSYLDHARNYLDTKVLSMSNKGIVDFDDLELTWKVGCDIQDFDFSTNEWKMLDSAGYSVPYSNNSIEMEFFKRNKSHITNYIYSGNLNGQYIWRQSGGSSFSLDAGVRFNYSNINNEFFLSPRARLVFKPVSSQYLSFNLSVGSYNQPVFFKEMVDEFGQFHNDVMSQKSWHFVLGNTFEFKWWGRPFKFDTELYYKYMYDLNPYKMKNVQIVYAANNSATGYAYGADIKLNGEFVEGVESWVSISVLRTKEDIDGDFYLNKNDEKTDIGYYPRPTDRLFNFSLFFQDYLPVFPSWKVNLTAFFGTGMPQQMPFSDNPNNFFRIPDYKRIDIGFSKVFKKKGLIKNDSRILKPFKGFWVGLEVFNLLDTKNTISHMWVKSVNGSTGEQGQYAVPNYLTGRVINVKISAEF